MSLANIKRSQNSLYIRLGLVLILSTTIIMGVHGVVNYILVKKTMTQKTKYLLTKRRIWIPIHPDYDHFHYEVRI